MRWEGLNTEVSLYPEQHCGASNNNFPMGIDLKLNNKIKLLLCKTLRYHRCVCLLSW